MLLDLLVLRALYFLLAYLKNRFRYLKLGLAVILVFVGVKLTRSPGCSTWSAGAGWRLTRIR